MKLLEVYQWYLEEQQLVHDMSSFFAVEVNLNEVQCDEFFQLVSEEQLTTNDVANIIQDNYGDTLCIEVYMDILEQSTQAELIRKRNIEKNRKKLGSQFKRQKGDTPEQALNKSVNSLTVHKIGKQGEFIVKKKPSDIGVVRKELIAKKRRSESSKAKVDAAKATEKRKQQKGSNVTKGVGAAKFVSNLKLAA